MIAIKSFFLVSLWMEMESCSPASPLEPMCFLSILSALPGTYIVSSYSLPILFIFCLHWQAELHLEAFPASTLFSVVSKEKIPWTRSTGRNHSLSLVSQKGYSAYCHIPGQCSETEAHWGCGTAHKQSVESRSALPSGPVAHTDCKKVKPDQKVQSWRKVRANRRGKYHRNAIRVNKDCSNDPKLAQTTGRNSITFNKFWIIC